MDRLHAFRGMESQAGRVHEQGAESVTLLRSLIRVLLAAAMAATFASTPAVAQTQPLRLIVPYPPGPGVDLIARTVSSQLSQTLGRPIVVDNRPGAGSVIGVDLAAKSPPDGNTLLFVN